MTWPQVCVSCQCHRQEELWLLFIDSVIEWFGLEGVLKIIQFQLEWLWRCGPGVGPGHGALLREALCLYALL